VFLVNRGQSAPLPVEIVWQGVTPARMGMVVQMAGTDPKAANTFARPDAVTPRTLPGVPVEDGVATATLPPLSFTVLAGR
jgi:alpha-N-arabinofuranosidase